MSKKKKKKKQLKKLDMNLNLKYSDLLKEIDYMQRRLQKVDKKAKKKAKKKANGDISLYKKYYKNDPDRIAARKKVIEDKSFFDNLYNVLEDMEPAAKLISRFIAALIISLLSISAIKVHITPEQLKVLDKVYTLSMKV